MLRSIGQLRDPAAFRGWAYRIVHARAVDWVRQSKRQREAIENQAHECSQTEKATPDNAADQQQQLATAIERLPPDEHLLLRMYYLERMPIGEIAAALEMPSGTVKYRLFQLRKNLRQLIEGERHASQKH